MYLGLVFKQGWWSRTSVTGVKLEGEYDVLGSQISLHGAAHKYTNHWAKAYKETPLT